MSAKDSGSVGELLLALVDRVSHRGGDTLSLLTETGMTLPQVLFLTRLRQSGGSTPSELAERLGMSLPAVSQMVDRLFQLGLLTRVEDPEDRRRKRLATTPRADDLLERLRRARGEEYNKGTAKLSPAVRRELAAALAKAVKELSLERGPPGPLINQDCGPGGLRSKRGT
ncbi:MAG: MarR family transcriptional regulator [Alphaproteobacteria bacterium]|nr:MarR family transcriptional regulator [Alphaproteobacteria bacterium]